MDKNLDKKIKYGTDHYLIEQQDRVKANKFVRRWHRHNKNVVPKLQFILSGLVTKKSSSIWQGVLYHNDGCNHFLLYHLLLNHSAHNQIFNRKLAKLG